MLCYKMVQLSEHDSLKLDQLMFCKIFFWDTNSSLVVSGCYCHLDLLAVTCLENRLYIYNNVFHCFEKCFLCPIADSIEFLSPVFRVCVL